MSDERPWVTKGTRVRHGDWMHAEHIEGECDYQPEGES